ncbi:hypothetical protein TREMEDRAFT_63392 [Tremella mesenterica DSM 1558]|uniref:uncharacterized protein n=1 Tax=Tremella mesenterica (strain ATCC 24925 / CBS 8224 / DSM 1558 / NBRC 9311 / NRRL Y-6157 / RJB 2259-6 / UBC 559-6) TaxID=578456 RepID=UPI0003F49240|nr:uncharacterized protein TREMEDRAFT_63392 [Tremella mesenterica DSM 1558]EIW68228.1 hypothetical protein TREMEDRAFT_63392 [Tremella mesenterica DSM 1558]
MLGSHKSRHHSIAEPIPSSPQLMWLGAHPFHIEPRVARPSLIRSPPLSPSKYHVGYFGEESLGRFDSPTDILYCHARYSHGSTPSIANASPDVGANVRRRHSSKLPQESVKVRRVSFSQDVQREGWQPHRAKDQVDDTIRLQSPNVTDVEDKDRSDTEARQPSSPISPILKTPMTANIAQPISQLTKSRPFPGRTQHVSIRRDPVMLCAHSPISATPVPIEKILDNLSLEPSPTSPFKIQDLIPASLSDPVYRTYHGLPSGSPQYLEFRTRKDRDRILRAKANSMAFDSPPGDSVGRGVHRRVTLH